MAATVAELRDWLRLAMKENNQDSDFEANIDYLFRHETYYTKHYPDGQASTTTPIQYFWTVPDDAQQVKVIDVQYICQTALTADASNYATVTLQKADGAGGSPSDMASITTEVSGSGNWVAGSGVELTITEDDIYAGNVLGFKIAKTGTGVNVPAGRLQVIYVIRG